MQGRKGPEEVTAHDTRQPLPPLYDLFSFKTPRRCAPERNIVRAGNVAHSTAADCQPWSDGHQILNFYDVLLILIQL